jgi:polyisoprenoid-binding protein YceI
MKKTLAAGILILLVAIPVFSQNSTYVVVRRLSNLTFDVSAQMHDVHGVSKDFSGTITGDPADITSATISIKLDPKGFDTDNEKRDRDMREKCLEIQKYPFIEFESTAIEASQKQLVPDQPVSATIRGTLKLHGLEKQISVPVKILLKEDVLTAEGDLAIVLDEYQILRPKVLFVQLQNDVKIHFVIGARKSQ